MKPTQQEQRQRQKKNPRPKRKTKETRRRGTKKNNNTTTEKNIRIEIHRQKSYTTYVAPMTCEQKHRLEKTTREIESEEKGERAKRKRHELVEDT